MQSIFTDIGKLNLNEPAHSYVLPFAQGMPATAPSTSAAWISHQGEAVFALASPSGGVTVVTLPAHDQDGLSVYILIFIGLTLYIWVVRGRLKG